MYQIKICNLCLTYIVICEDMTRRPTTLLKKISSKSVFGYKKQVTPLALLGFPIVILIKIANALKVIWFNLIYAISLLTIAQSFV